MTALRFKTGDGASDFPGPPGGGGETGCHSDCLCKVAPFFHVYRVYTDLSFSKTFFLSLSVQLQAVNIHLAICLVPQLHFDDVRRSLPPSQRSQPLHQQCLATAHRPLNQRRSPRRHCQGKAAQAVHHGWHANPMMLKTYKWSVLHLPHKVYIMEYNVQILICLCCCLLVLKRTDFSHCIFETLEA